jgi:hypothetical protein
LCIAQTDGTEPVTKLLFGFVSFAKEIEKEKKKKKT